MTSEQLGRAFEPFFTTKRGNHLGLGLAQANSVLSQASGSLQLSSQAGVGTTVELILPCVELPMVRMPADERGSTQKLATSQRLLVIDDDDEVRAVIVALLREMEYDVVEANGGKAGLESLRGQMPSLAIIDYLMPDMNGAEVARRVRQQAPELPIVFISGYSDSEAIATIPLSRVLRKPVAAEELAQAVASALQTA
jgi:CheY-like chemotaxis protein